MKTNEIRIFTKAYNDYKFIQSEKDLNKNKLTLAEYREVERILKSLCYIDGNKETTIMSNVKTWFEKRGWNIREFGIGWEISII